MKILVVGGGQVAANLVKLMRDRSDLNAKITLIEKDYTVGQRLANASDVSIICGDGSQQQVLASAGCADADLFLALTGRDEDNLVACQLAKKVFHVQTPICRVNHPHNIPVFKKLGIHNTFSSSLLLAKVLTQEISHSGLYVVYDIPGNSKAIVEFIMKPDAEEIGSYLSEINFPRDSRVVLVAHRQEDGSEQVELAQGQTVLRANDRVMMVCDFDDFDTIRKRFVATPSEEDALVPSEPTED